MARTASSCSSRPWRACSTSVAGRGGPAERDVRAGPARSRPPRRPPGPPRPRGPAARDARSRGPGPRAPGLGGAQQLVGAAVQRAGSLLGGAQREPGLHLGCARRAGRLGELLAVVDARARRSGPPRRGPAVPRGRRARPGPARGPPRPRRSPGRAARPRPGRRAPGRRTGRAPRPPRPGWRRTRAAWPGRRRPASGPRAARCSSRDMSKPSRSVAATASDSCWAGLVDRGLDLDAGSAGWPSHRRRRARRAGRRRGSPRSARGRWRRSAPGRGQVVDHGDPVEQPRAARDGRRRGR